MLCEYCIVTAYTQPCRCAIGDDICPFTRRCNIAHKWLPLDGMNSCLLRNKQEQSKEVFNLKKNEYKVEYVQNNKLYINFDGNLIRMINPYAYEPKTVELVRVDDELYIKDFAPRKEKASKSKEEDE